LASAQAPVHAAGLVALSSDAVVLRTKSDAVLRSLLVPGWGQLYNRQEEKGALLMVAAGGLAAGGIAAHVLGTLSEQTYAKISRETPGPCAGRPDDQFGACVYQQRVEAQERYQLRNWLFIGLGAVWLYNL